MVYSTTRNSTTVRRGRWVGHPFPWLAGVALFVLALLWMSGRLVTEIQPDSESYIRYNWNSPSAMLSNQRTCGYPAFLRLAAWTGPDWCAIPLIHWAALVTAVCICYWGLIQAHFSPETAGWVAVALLFNRGLLFFGNALVPDSLTISCAIATAGCFFAATARNPRRLAWFGLLTGTILCYQLKPSFLFLIPLWPWLSLMFDRLLLRREAGLADGLRRAGWFAAATMIPFVAFCTMRWTVIDHWGLVSFGGSNAIGITGQFLDEELVQKLPADLQPLANRMLEKRRGLSEYVPPDNFPAMEKMWAPFIVDVGGPAAREFHPQDAVAANDSLTRLSIELVKLKPRSYLKWLIWNSLNACSQILLMTFTDRGTLFIGCLWLLGQGWLLCRGPRPQQEECPSESVQQRHREKHLLLWTALFFASASALLVIPVGTTIERYMTGVMVFLPAAISVFAAHSLQEIFRNTPFRDNASVTNESDRSPG